MYKFLLYLIIVLHTLLVLFIVTVPFFGKNYLLFLHILGGTAILAHWIANNNICSLTLLENKIREIITNKPVNPNDSFMARLINPIYDFKKNNHSRRVFLYSLLVGLVLLSMYKLLRNYKQGNLKNIYDFYFKG
jgi:hypothetical protein